MESATGTKAMIVKVQVVLRLVNGGIVTGSVVTGTSVVVVNTLIENVVKESVRHNGSQTNLLYVASKEFSKGKVRRFNKMSNNLLRI